MLIAHWNWLFAAGIITSAVAVYDPELPVTLYASTISLFVWALLGWGATTPVAISQGATVVGPASPGLMLLCWLNALISGLIPLTAALWDWIDQHRTALPAETGVKSDV